MPTNVPRIQVTPSCQSHSELLNYWAVIEGRSVSSLCSTLLEEAVVKAIKEDRVNPIAVKMVDKLMDARKQSLDLKFGIDLQELSESTGYERSEWLERDDYFEVKQYLSVADYVWKDLDKKDDGEQNNYDFQMKVIKDAMKYIDLDDEKSGKSVELILIKSLMNSSDVSISQLLELIEQLNKVHDDGDNGKVNYLKHSLYIWEDHFRGKCPAPLYIYSEKELKAFANEHKIYPF